MRSDAKIVLYANGGIRTYEKYPVRGFLSSMEGPVHIGLDKTRVDSAFLIWPDNTCQRIQLEPVDSLISFSYRKGLPEYDYAIIRNHWKNPTRPVEGYNRRKQIFYISTRKTRFMNLNGNR